MAILDIGLVTKLYIKVIKFAFATNPEWTQPVPSVLPLPPGNMTATGVTFYLYHTIERKEYANFQVATRDQPPVSFLPMGMNLYFQLTTHSNNENPEEDTYTEQQMMSVAMKALHDCPFMDETTMIQDTPNHLVSLFNNDVKLVAKENKFRISQLPVAYNEAVHNWTAGEAPMKLSAYYEVTPVFLEPEVSKSYAGRVLAYGNYVFATGAPRITSAENVVSYLIPGQSDAHQIKIQPAQAPPSVSGGGVALPESKVTFKGDGITGDVIQLRLLNADWNVEVIAGPDWSLAASGGNALYVDVREAAITVNGGAVVAVLPGIYSAQIVTTRKVIASGGLQHNFRNTSNQYPFTICPRIDSVSGLVGSVVTVVGFIFQHIAGAVDTLADKVDVYLGADRMVRNKGGAFSQGEFRVLTPGKLEINIPGSPAPGTLIPLRILVNGVESGPQWILV